MATNFESARLLNTLNGMDSRLEGLLLDFILGGGDSDLQCCVPTGGFCEDTRGFCTGLVDVEC